MNAAIRGQTAASAEVGALMNRSAVDLIQSSLSIGDIAVHSNTSTSTAAVTRIAGTTARNCWRPLLHPGRGKGFCCLVVILSVFAPPSARPSSPYLMVAWRMMRDS